MMIFSVDLITKRAWTFAFTFECETTRIVSPPPPPPPPSPHTPARYSFNLNALFFSYLSLSPHSVNCLSWKVIFSYLCLSPLGKLFILKNSSFPSSLSPLGKLFILKNSSFRPPSPHSVNCPAWKLPSPLHVYQAEVETKLPTNASTSHPYEKLRRLLTFHRKTCMRCLGGEWCEKNSTCKSRLWPSSMKRYRFDCSSRGSRRYDSELTPVGSGLANFDRLLNRHHPVDETSSTFDKGNSHSRDSTWMKNPVFHHLNSREPDGFLLAVLFSKVCSLCCLVCSECEMKRWCPLVRDPRSWPGLVWKFGVVSPSTAVSKTKWMLPTPATAYD